MKGFVLQDWVTIRGATTTTSVAQSQADYLDLAAFEDFVAWIEVDEVTTGGAANVTLWLETAPTPEETWFQVLNGSSSPAATQLSVTVATGVTTVKNILNQPQSSTQVPVGRWLRWRLAVSGASSVWSVTFRIHVAAHSMCIPRTAS